MQRHRQIGAQPGLSQNTVKYHPCHVLEELHRQNRAQAVAYAVRHRRRRAGVNRPVYWAASGVEPRAERTWGRGYFRHFTGSAGEHILAAR